VLYEMLTGKDAFTGTTTPACCKVFAEAAAEDAGQGPQAAAMAFQVKEEGRLAWTNFERHSQRFLRRFPSFYRLKERACSPIRH